MQNEFGEEKSLTSRPPDVALPIVVSVNNTAKKREIFEVKAANKNDANDPRKSSTADVVIASAIDKSKFDESVDEIRDVLGRLRPSSNFPYVKQTVENLLVNN